MVQEQSQFNNDNLKNVRNENNTLQKQKEGIPERA